MVPSRKRSAYLPWTPSLRSLRRSYSERRSSAFSRLDFFFIRLSLFTGKLPCTDDADSLSTVSMSYHQQPTAAGESEGDKANFLLGMIRIEDCDTQRVTENTGSLSERNAVFSQIRSCFGWVPLELYHDLSNICHKRNNGYIDPHDTPKIPLDAIRNRQGRNSLPGRESRPSATSFDLS